MDVIQPVRRRGRPTAVYRTADGTQIPGLMRLADGRWRASGPEKHTYTALDEKAAIRHFMVWQAKQAGTAVGATLATADSSSLSN